MERTRLGRTGIEVSRLCIGCMQASGWVSSDDEQFVATVRHAVDLGLNFLDSAAGYGRTPGQTALRWLPDQEGITATIVGASHPEQVDENLGAMDWKLERADWQRLSDISWPLSAELGSHDALSGWHSKKG
jgi:aryl-alcohol dehydrogenase-like predicted oxidoreductase